MTTRTEDIYNLRPLDESRRLSSKKSKRSKPSIAEGQKEDLSGKSLLYFAGKSACAAEMANSMLRNSLDYHMAEGAKKEAMLRKFGAGGMGIMAIRSMTLSSCTDKTPAASLPEIQRGLRGFKADVVLGLMRHDELTVRLEALRDDAQARADALSSALIETSAWRDARVRGAAQLSNFGDASSSAEPPGIGEVSRFISNFDLAALRAVFSAAERDHVSVAAAAQNMISSV